ncbi:MAG: sugar phosphate isomerase/epimerase [Verrucomicrobia bacterium]|nr:sugar phosphate isomerase/epimerase [Verrucomicrobiota bacterium]
MRSQGPKAQSSNRLRDAGVRLAMLTAMAPDWSARRVLKELRTVGLRRVEWAAHYPVGKLPVTRPWHLDLTPRSGNTERIRDLCQEFEMEVACLSGPQQLDDGEGAERLLKAARILRCRMVRLGAPLYRVKIPPLGSLKAAAKALARWVPRARDFGVRILVETHQGNLTCSPELALRVVERSDPQDVGVILDPANMAVEGMLGWPFAVGLLGPYLAHVHVKNLAWFRQDGAGWRFDYTSLPDGLVDWPAVIAALETAGYRGLYSFEDFRGGYCRRPRGIRTVEKLREDVACLVEWLRRPVPAMNRHPPADHGRQASRTGTTHNKKAHHENCRNLR